MIDVHNHILPGIDDGSGSMAVTLQMLKIAANSGITDMIATPHFKHGRHNASPQKIRMLVEQVQQLAMEHDIPITLYPGNEIFYFSDMEDALQDKLLCTLNHSEYVLVEFLPNEHYSYIRNAMDNLLGMGYCPVLAHVERYACMWKNPELAEELVIMGVQLQVNASSVAGEAGWRIKQYTRILLKKHLVTYIGTDAHDESRRTPDVERCTKYIQKRLDKEYASAVLERNARVNLLS